MTKKPNRGNNENLDKVVRLVSILVQHYNNPKCEDHVTLNRGDFVSIID